MRVNGTFVHMHTSPYTQREHTNSISDSSSFAGTLYPGLTSFWESHVVGARDSLLHTQKHSDAPTSLVLFQWLFEKHADMSPEWLDWRTPERLVTPC